MSLFSILRANRIQLGLGMQRYVIYHNFDLCNNKSTDQSMLLTANWNLSGYLLPKLQIIGWKDNVSSIVLFGLALILL